MKHLISIILVALLLLIPITYMFHEFRDIQQQKVLESEKLISCLTSILDELKEHDTRVITIILENRQETQPTQPTETEEPTQPTTPTQPTEPEPTQPHPANYYGRLVIPDAGISVGLYHGADPAITDREDSANLFSMRVFDGLYIADHNNQEFSKLYRVTVGMRGYIRTADGTVFNIVCTDILNGHNNGKIIDEDGNTNFDAHFLMYTCRDHWTNILICLWKHC